MTTDGDTAQVALETADEKSLPAGPRKIRSASAAHQGASNIVLFGLFGCGNLGNDGSLEAMVGFLRHARPNAKLYCVCSHPDVVAREMGIETLPIRKPRPPAPLGIIGRLLMWGPRRAVDLAYSLGHLRGADVMIIPGTGILDDFGERPYGMPLTILAWCLAARFTGTRIALVCIGAGPIRNRVSRWLMIQSARLAQYRSYRDHVSKEFMSRNAGFDTAGDPVFPDIAFKLPVPSGKLMPANENGLLTIGVGVMSYYGWYGFADGGQEIFARYIDKLVRFVVHLLDQGHAVRLLTGELDDSFAVNTLLARVRAARPDLSEARILAEPSASLHEVMRQMADADIIVATRFHNIVCALKMGKPTISLGYARKNDVLLGEMGLGDYCQHVETFDVATLIRQLNDLANRRDEHANQVCEKVRMFQQELARQDQILLASIV